MLRPFFAMKTKAARFSKAKGKARLTDVEALAAKLEPGLAKAILDALKAQKDAVSLDAILEALKAGSIDKVLAALNIENIEALFTGVKDKATQAAWAGAALAGPAITLQLRGTTFAFDQLNPRLIDWLRQYNLGLIKSITESTRDAVRGVLVDGMTAGKNPIAVARQVKGAIGLTERQAKAVARFRSELESFHTRRTGGGYNLGAKKDKVYGLDVFKPDASGKPKDGITERRLRDFRFDGTLARAVETGKPLSEAQIDKMVARYEERWLKYRAQTIARTEALRTTNVGVQDAWRQAVEKNKVSESLLRRMWIVAKDERLCEICAPIPGMNPKRGVKFGQPFATPKGPQMMPPSHPNCRCTIFIRQWEPSQLADE